MPGVKWACIPVYYALKANYEWFAVLAATSAQRQCLHEHAGTFVVDIVLIIVPWLLKLSIHLLVVE